VIREQLLRHCKTEKKHNQSVDGLDFVLVEMGKRDLNAILYLNNNWNGITAEWQNSLEWNGYGNYNPNIALKYLASIYELYHAISLVRTL
jgi:hypothetical protein